MSLGAGGDSLNADSGPPDFALLSDLDASALSGAGTSEVEDATSGAVPSNKTPHAQAVMAPTQRGRGAGTEPCRASSAPAAPRPAATGRTSSAQRSDALKTISSLSGPAERFTLRLARTAVSSTIVV